MLSKEYRRAYTELSEVLKLADENEMKKIPQKFTKYINKNKDKNYNFHISSLDNINKVSKETKALLSIVYRQFLCENDYQKMSFDNILMQNIKGAIK